MASAHPEHVTTAIPCHASMCRTLLFPDTRCSYALSYAATVNPQDLHQQVESQGDLLLLPGFFATPEDHEGDLGPLRSVSSGGSELYAMSTSEVRF